MRSAAQNSLRSIERLPLNSTGFEPISPKNKVHYIGYTRTDSDLDSSVRVLNGNTIGFNYTNGFHQHKIQRQQRFSVFRGLESLKAEVLFWHDHK